MSQPQAVNGAPSEGAVPPPAADAPAAPAPPATPPPPQGDGFDALEQEYDTLANSEGDVIQLPKDKLSRWNDEHKKYRERWRPYEDAFKSMHPNDAELIRDWVGNFTSSDESKRMAAIEWMRDEMSKLSPAQQAAAAAAIDADPATQNLLGEEPQPLTQEEIDRLVDQKIDTRMETQQKQQAVRDAQVKLDARAKELGYQPDTTDWALLYLTAQQSFSTDPDPLGKAHEVIEARLNEKAQELLKQKRADATQPTAPENGMAPSGRKQPMTMDDAERSARATLDKMFKSQPGT